MIPRRSLTHVIVLAVALVAVAAGASPAARTIPDRGTLDLLASAHPTSARPTVTDTAYSSTRLHGWLVKADTAALTSNTCDGCVGHSAALHVVYVSHPRKAEIANVATAWTQGCRDCAGTALSVQVVVLGNRPTVLPDNRALAVNAACEGCRASALAFQVVMVADRAAPLTDDELAELRGWFEGQVAALRSSVAAPPPTTPESSTTPTPTPTPTPSETPTTSPTPMAVEPTGATTAPSPTPQAETLRAAPDPRRARRDAASALNELEALLTSALDAEPVAADVDLSR